MANTRLQGPPTNTQIVISSGFVTRRWGAWLHGLYQKMGGTESFGSYTIQASITDISVPATIYINVPFTGSIALFRSVIQSNIVTVDEVVKIRNPDGVIIGTITIPVLSTAGADGSTIINTNNTVSAGDVISIESLGNSSSACPAGFSVIIDKT